MLRSKYRFPRVTNQYPLRRSRASFSLARMSLRRSASALALLLCFWSAGCHPSSERQSAEQDNPHFKAGREKREALDYKGAIEAFESALEDNPRSVLAHFELGVLYEQQEADYAAALYHYNRALKLRPSGYPADNIRQRIPACKQEMVKADSLAVMNPTALRETEKLREDNQKLQQENLALRAQLAGRPVSPPQGNSPAPATSTASPVRPPPNAASNGSRPQAAPAPSTSTATPAHETPRPSPSSSQSRVTTLPPRPPAASAARTHAVKSGETIASIARQHGVSQTRLQSANPGVDPRRLRVGVILNLP